LTGDDARHAVATKDSHGSEPITLAEGLAIIDELIQRYAQ